MALKHGAGHGRPDHDYPCPDCGKPTIRSFSDPKSWVHVRDVDDHNCPLVRERIDFGTALVGGSSTPSTPAGRYFSPELAEVLVTNPKVRIAPGGLQVDPTDKGSDEPWLPALGGTLVPHDTSRWGQVRRGVA